MNIGFNGKVNPWTSMETNSTTRQESTLKSSRSERIYSERMYSESGGNSEMIVETSSSMMNNTSSTVNNRNNQNSDDNNVYGQLQGNLNTNINNNGHDVRGLLPSINSSLVQTNDMILCRTPRAPSDSLTSTTNSFVWNGNEN